MNHRKSAGTGHVNPVSFPGFGPALGDYSSGKGFSLPWGGLTGGETGGKVVKASRAELRQGSWVSPLSARRVFLMGGQGDSL